MRNAFQISAAGAIAGASGCCGVGVLLGVLLSRRVLRGRLETEIREVKSYYHLRAAEAGAAEGANPDDGTPPVGASDGDAGAYEAEEPMESVDAPDPATAIALFERDTSRPYVISIMEFTEERDDYQKLTITYYEDDDVLVDDKETPITNKGNMVGPEIETKFGIASEDPNLAFIRNEKLEIDFEVVRNMGSYTEEVLGYGSVKQQARKIREDPRGLS